MDDKYDAEELWRSTYTYIKTVVDTLRQPFLILDKDLNVLSANKVFYLFFDESPKETEGKKVYKLGNEQWNIPKLNILLEDILPRNTHFEDFKVEHDFPKIGHKIIMLNARQIFKPNNEDLMILLAMEDITKQVELEDKLKEYTERLTIDVAEKTKELEKRIEQLERLNHAMVNRELAMVELKEQIIKLKETIENSKK